MSQLKISLAKWLSSRKRLYQLEAIFYTSSSIFNFVALAGAVYLLYRMKIKNFQAFDSGDAYLLVFITSLIGLNGAHFLFTTFFRNKRRRLESDIHDDGLAPVYDQDSIYEIMRREMRRAGRYHLPLSMCFVAIDRFEDIVRRKGRKFRHQLIQNFTNLTVEVIRSSDYVAHLGGNRFAILLCHTDLTHAENFAYRLLVQSQERLELSFSAGLTDYRTGENPGEFIKRSQQALKEAHEKGLEKTRCAIGRDDNLVIKSL